MKRGQIKKVRIGPPKHGLPKVVKHSLAWFKKHFPNTTVTPQSGA